MKQKPRPGQRSGSGFSGGYRPAGPLPPLPPPPARPPANQLESSLRLACGMLNGMSQADVAELLRRAGLRGKTRSPRHCPLARWLHGQPGLEGAAIETSGGIVTARRGSDEATAILPDGAYQFDIAFDGGRWDDLDEDSWCSCGRDGQDGGGAGGAPASQGTLF